MILARVRQWGFLKALMTLVHKNSQEYEMDANREFCWADPTLKEFRRKVHKSAPEKAH